MAEIKGFQLRNVVNFKGHEQEPLVQGDIWYEGKNVGYFSQDSRGGEDIINFKHEAYEQLAKQRTKDYFTEYPDSTCDFYKLEPDVGMFLLEILYLSYIEKDYKKYCGEKQPLTYGIASYVYKSNMYVKVLGSAGSEKLLQNNKEVSQLRIFVKKDDFIIN